MSGNRVGENLSFEFLIPLSEIYSNLESVNGKSVIQKVIKVPYGIIRSVVYLIIEKGSKKNLS